ncbi:MAG: mandelate racemase/muconate lactonizing enzyme family protein [Candidatus Handelsmanbacteria bacterium]|nr:mandelate racemase/muconate lactonizing enzyme family protein [Candidatus Handelsmanbacteria bacterium]
MKITRVETVQTPEYGHLVWVRIHTDSGLVGLGESYLYPEPIKSAVLKHFAPEWLLGKDPLEIEARWRAIFERVNFAGWAGAEMRAMSAIDIALWDLLGQQAGLPIHQLLGGKCRERLRVYNTCGPYRGLDFNHNADEYALHLLEQGITAMKIWPFDGFGLQTGGQLLSLQDLDAGLEPVRKIRRAVGERMEIAMEFHGYWNLNCAVRIAQALEEHRVMWVEDILKPDNLDAYEHLSLATRLPLTVSERLLTRYQFLPVMQRGIARVIMPDVEWCGGITEAKKIASLADTFQLPVAFHNYGGPVLNFASAQVAASIPNLMLVEVGLNLLACWAETMITQPVVVQNGYMELPQGPGLGVALQESFLRRPEVVVEGVNL